MARNKKSKRPNLPQETLERARAELRGDTYIASDDDENDSPAAAAVSTRAKVSPVSVQANKVRRAASQTVRRIPNLQDLLAEYHYVLRDLRNLAILAGVLLVAIVVMSFVLGGIAG